MNTLLKLVVVGLTLFSAAYLFQVYAASWYSKVAFTAPVIGTMSYAACALTAFACLLLAKVNFGK